MSRSRYVYTNANLAVPTPESITATRDKSCILYPYDLSGVSIYNGWTAVTQGNGGNFKGVLISDRHLIFATHVMTGGTPANFKMVFINNNNQNFTYTVSSVITLTNDIMIGVLTTTVDPSLKKYKVLPYNFFINYTNKTLNKYQSPLTAFYLTVNTNDNLLNTVCVADCTASFPPSVNTPSLALYVSYDALRASYVLPTPPGNSSNPVFAILNNELIYLGGLWVSDGTIGGGGSLIASCPFISAHIKSINNAMTSLAGTSYQLTQLDISNYSTYNLPQTPWVNPFNDTYTYRLRPTIFGTGYHPGTIKIYDNGIYLDQVSSTNNNLWTFIPSSNLSLGSHEIKTTSFVSGEESNYSVSRTLSVQQLPAPVVTGIGNSSIYDLTPTINGTCISSTPDSDNLALKLYIDGVYAYTGAQNAGNWSVAITEPGFTIGVQVVITATISVTYNSAENVSPVSNAFNYTVTRTPSPVLSATSPTTDTTPTITLSSIIVPEANYVVLVYMSTDPNASVDTYSLASPPTATGPDGNGNFTWTPGSALSPGTYYFSASQRWNLFNISNRSSRLTIVIQ